MIESLAVVVTIGNAKGIEIAVATASLPERGLKHVGWASRLQMYTTTPSNKTTMAASKTASTMNFTGSPSSSVVISESTESLVALPLRVGDDGGDVPIVAPIKAAASFGASSVSLVGRQRPNSPFDRGSARCAPAPHR